MRGGGGLADPALEIRHGDDLGRQPLGPPGQVVLRLRPLGAEEGAQLQHLVEGEPLGPALRLGGALRQVGVLAQHAAEMGRGDGDQVFRDLPGREGAQAAGAVLLQSATGEVLAPGAAGLRYGGEALGRLGIPERFQRRIGREIEIGGEVVTAHRALMSHVFCKVRQKAVHARIIGTSGGFLSKSAQGHVAMRDLSTTPCG